MCGAQGEAAGGGRRGVGLADPQVHEYTLVHVFLLHIGPADSQAGYPICVPLVVSCTVVLQK